MADANQVDGNWSCSLFRQWLIPPAGQHALVSIEWP